MTKNTCENSYEPCQPNEGPWTPLSSSFGTFPDGATSQEKADLVHKARRELVYWFFTDINEEQGVADGENLYLTLLVNNLDGHFDDEEFLLRTHRLQAAKRSGCRHGTPKFEEAMEAAGVFDVYQKRGCDGYDFRHRLLTIRAAAVENAFGVCSHSVFRELPEMDDPEGILSQCKQLASVVAKEATDPRTLVSVAAWLIAQGIGGLITSFELQDKAKKILCLIDRVAEGDSLINTIVESALFSDLLFTPTYADMGILAEPFDGLFRSVLKCRNCDSLFVESLCSAGSRERLAFAGSIEKGYSPADLLKWERLRVINAVCPSCGLSSTSILEQWEKKALSRPLLSPTGQLIQPRTSV